MFSILQKHSKEIIVISSCISLALLLQVTNTFAKIVVPALTPSAQESYNSARTTLCFAEKTLASAKLIDYANGLLKLNKEELIDLAAKQDTDCYGF